MLFAIYHVGLDIRVVDVDADTACYATLGEVSISSLAGAIDGSTPPVHVQPTALGEVRGAVAIATRGERLASYAPVYVTALVHLVGEDGPMHSATIAYETTGDKARDRLYPELLEQFSKAVRAAKRAATAAGWPVTALLLAEALRQGRPRVHPELDGAQGYFWPRAQEGFDPVPSVPASYIRGEARGE